MAESDVDERICREYQDEKLCGAGDMVVEKSPFVQLIKIVIDGAVEHGQEKYLQDIIFDHEEDDEYDGNYEAGEWCQFGNARERHVLNVRVWLDVDVRVNMGPHTARSVS